MRGILRETNGFACLLLVVLSEPADVLPRRHEHVARSELGRIGEIAAHQLRSLPQVLLGRDRRERDRCGRCGVARVHVRVERSDRRVFQRKRNVQKARQFIDKGQYTPRV